MEERRLHPRLDLPLQAVIVTEGAERRATLENLSAGGAAVRVAEELRAGAELERLEFTVPASDATTGFAISSRAEVMHTERLEQPNGKGGFRAGIRFVDLSEDSFRRIQQHIYQALTKGRPEVSEMPLDRRRIKVERAVSIHYDRFDKFVSEVSENISLGGMFIRTSAPKPPGSIFSFSFQLGEDFSLVEGRAEVVWTREKNLGERRLAGMGVRFLDLDERSRNTILSLVQKAGEEKGPEEPAAGRIHVAAVHPKAPVGTVARDIERTTAKVTAAAGVARDGHSKESARLKRELARRTRAYEGRIAELEQRISELSSRHVDEETRLRQSESSAGELQSLNATLEQRLEEMKTRLGHEKEDLRTQLEAANRDLEELRLEKKTRQGEIESARRKTAGFENRLLVIEQALRSAERERDEATTNAKESALALKELEKSAGEGGGEESPRVAELESQIEESANRLQVLGERLAAAEKDRDQALGKLTLVSTTEASLQQAEARQQELQGEIDEAQEALRRAHEGHDSRTAELREEVKRASASADVEKRRAQSAETAREELERELALAREQLEKSRREQLDVQSELGKELELANSTAAARISELELALEEAAQQRQELERALEEADAESLKVETEREELETGLREEAREAVAKVSELESAVAERESKLEAAEQGRSSLEEQLASAAEDREGVEEALSREQARREDAEREWATREAELRGSMSEATAGADELRATVESLEAALEQRAIEQREQEEAWRKTEEEHLSEIAALRERQGSLEEQLEGSTATAEDLRKRVESLEQEIEERAAEARERTETVRITEEELRSELAEATRREESARHQLEAAGSTESRLEQALDEERQARENALEEVARLRSVAETLDGDLGIVRVEVGDKDRRLRDLERELEQSRERADLVTSELDERVAELADREHALSAVASDLEEARREGETLQGEVSTLQSAVRGYEVVLPEAGTEPMREPLSAARTQGGGTKAGGGRWLRAAALLVGGIGVGALVGPPAARLLGVEQGLGGWLGASRQEARVAERLPAESLTAVESTDVMPQDAVPVASGSVNQAAGAAGAGEEQPGESVGEPPGEPYPEAQGVAQAWATAWSEQRVDDYLWFYADEFVPPNGMTRPEWEAYRRERVSSPASIEVTLADVSRESIDADRTRVVFEQAYRAGAYRDRVRKTLEMVREDGTWKITSEESEPLE